MYFEDAAFDNLFSQLKAESSDGAKLLVNPNDNPICTVSFDDSLQGIVVTWKHYATSTQIRFIHEHILQLIKQYRVDRILSDDSALQTIDSEDQAWIAHNWMPRAVAAGLRTTASKAPDSHFGRVAVANIQAEAPRGLILRTFDDLAAARRWLKDFD